MTTTSSVKTIPCDGERIEAAIAAAGTHKPASDYVFDLSEHARELSNEAGALRQILATDAVVRRTEADYKNYDALAVKARKRFELAIEAISLVLISAIMLALFLNAVPPAIDWPVRTGLSLILGIIIVAFLSNFRAAIGIAKWNSWLVLALGVGVIAALVWILLRWVVPADFGAIVAPVRNGSIAVFIACIVAADAVSGGMTAHVFGRLLGLRARPLHSSWYEARGKAEANRRLLFMAVLQGEPPVGTPADAIPLLSQKLEYFRRFQVQVQQSYYSDKSKHNANGAKRADDARKWAFAGFVGLSLVMFTMWLARREEQNMYLLPNGLRAYVVRFVPSGAGNIALALAGVALCVCLYLLFGHQSDKPSGARQFTFARLGGWIALALSIITPLTIWVTLREEMGFHLLPDSFTAMLLSIVKMGGDDFALLLAFFALGTYCFLQLKSTLLRERINHRRFANAYAQLRQATSVSPEAADLNVARPLTDARKAALRGDSAAVERFVRDVNRLLASETGDWSVMTAYTIAKSVERQDARLFSSEKLSSEDFDAIVRDLSGYGGSMFRARKISFVSARKAAAIEPIETRYDGKESNDTAQPGDWIVTNMNTKRDIIRDSQGHLNTYVIRAADFVRLYSRDVGDNEFGEIYKAKGIVDAVHLPGGFDIVAPWGERQQGASGYLLRNGADVYGIYAKAYDETYEKV